MSPSPALDRKMMLYYIDQRRDYIDLQITISQPGSKDELYWMAAWAEATSIYNSVFTGNYNKPLDVHHAMLVPVKRETK